MIFRQDIELLCKLFKGKRDGENKERMREREKLKANPNNNVVSFPFVSFPLLFIVANLRYRLFS